jgi:hypothetical protein
MTGGAYRINEVQEGVSITVHAHLDESMEVPGGLSLDPEGLPAAGPVPSLLDGEGLFKSSPVDPGRHQDHTARCLNRRYRKQAFRPPGEAVQGFRPGDVFGKVWV